MSRIVFSTNCTASKQISLPARQALNCTFCESRISFALFHRRLQRSSFLLIGTTFGRSSSDVSVLFQDMRFEMEAIVWGAVPRRGGGGGALSEDEIDEASDWGPWE